jgi:hypothetical protein
MRKCGNLSELRADGSNLGPPVCVSSAATAHPPVIDPEPRCFGPLDPVFLEWLRTSETPARRVLARQIGK